MASGEPMQRYYERDRERDRLADGLGQLEFERTIEIMGRTFPSAPAVIADIGGGPGRYTDWLIEHGYQVIHRDIVPHHVDQVAARYRSDDRVATAVGDARDLDVADTSVDATLLLGPLYHLADPDDRAQVVAEAVRITRPGGRVYAAAIGRWAARIMGVLVERQFLDYPASIAAVEEVERSGVLPPVFDAAFTGYTHTLAEFQAEFDVPGLNLEAVVAIESIASAFTTEDIADRLSDETHRTVLMDSLRALETVPDLMGASSHLLAVALVTP